MRPSDWSKASSFLANTRPPSHPDSILFGLQFPVNRHASSRKRVGVDPSRTPGRVRERISTTGRTKRRASASLGN
eukprot:scaffold649_cov347-Pavlova_lutheri.AAC.8